MFPAERGQRRVFACKSILTNFSISLTVCVSSLPLFFNAFWHAVPIMLLSYSSVLFQSVWSPSRQIWKYAFVPNSISLTGLQSEAQTSDKVLTPNIAFYPQVQQALSLFWVFGETPVAYIAAAKTHHPYSQWMGGVAFFAATPECSLNYKVQRCYQLNAHKLMDILLYMTLDCILLLLLLEAQLVFTGLYAVGLVVPVVLRKCSFYSTM